MNDFAVQVREAGFAVIDNVLRDEDIVHLRSAIEAIPDSAAVRKRERVFGIRNLLDSCPAIRQIAVDDRVAKFVRSALGNRAMAVRAVFFDKVPGANWSLGWHQDSVIAVRERLDVPDFIAWGNKSDVWQVQPPAEILGRMLAIRIHLDDCGYDNGVLRVIPGSHRCGWVEDDLENWKVRVPEVACSVRSGGIVAMCPLLLHASSRSASPAHRRVIHIEYAADNLPAGLEWHWRIPLEPELNEV